MQAILDVPTTGTATVTSSPRMSAQKSGRPGHSDKTLFEHTLSSFLNRRLGLTLCVAQGAVHEREVVVPSAWTNATCGSISSTIWTVISCAEFQNALKSAVVF